MDNVTHALSGLLVAELAARFASRGQRELPSWRDAACLTSILAQNFPDLDLFLTGLTGGRIGYLVHHRGHTHTLVFALPLALLAMAPAWAWMRARGQALGRGWWPVFALAVLGGVMHIAMDGTNEYGVHPFWPLDARWYYGDSVFIVEPLLWASGIGALVFGLRSRVWKVLLGLLLAAIVLASLTLHAYVRPMTGWLVLGYALAMLALGRNRPWVGALAWASITAVYGALSTHVEATIRDISARVLPGDVIDDVALSPYPADPLCWRVTVISHDEARYRASTGRFSLAPSLVRASDCPKMGGDRTAPVTDISGDTSDARVAWNDRLDLPREELRALAQRCDALAILRFARIPFWKPHDDGLLLGDLRYDREPGLGFAEVALPSAVTACPPRVPAWVPPRALLLD